jgi:hypothetical protein
LTFVEFACSIKSRVERKREREKREREKERKFKRVHLDVIKRTEFMRLSALFVK